MAFGFFVVHRIFSISNEKFGELVVDVSFISVIRERVIFIKECDDFLIGNSFGEVWESGRHRHMWDRNPVLFLALI